MIYLFILSYIILHCVAYNKKCRCGLHQQYQLSVLLITVSYLYLIANALMLNYDDSLLLYHYTILIFIFFIVLLITIRSNIFRGYTKSNKILNKLDIILNELTGDRRLVLLYIILYLVSFFTVRWVSYEESIQYRLVTTGFEQVLWQIPKLLCFSAAQYLLIMSIIRARLYFYLPIIFSISIFMTLYGDRSAIIVSFFSIYYSLYRLQGIKIKIRYLIVAALMSAVLIITVGHSRGGITFLENLDSFWSILFDFDVKKYNILGIGEFYFPAHSIISSIEELPTDIFLMSKELSIFIPKIFWSDRPLPASESYMNILYNDLFMTGHGYGFSNIAFGYWWGGYFGLIVYAFLCGCFFKLINNIILEYKVLGCFVFITFFFNIFQFARGVSVVGLIKNAIVLQMIPVFINIIIIYLMITKVKVIFSRISSRDFNGVRK